jgi:hypothetical protein
LPSTAVHHPAASATDDALHLERHGTNILDTSDLSLVASEVDDMRV